MTKGFDGDTPSKPFGDEGEFTFTPDDDGAYVVMLAVTDKDGGTGTATATIDASNANPTLRLDDPSPTNPVPWQPVRFTGDMAAYCEQVLTVVPRVLGPRVGGADGVEGSHDARLHLGEALTAGERERRRCPLHGAPLGQLHQCLELGAGPLAEVALVEVCQGADPVASGLGDGGGDGPAGEGRPPDQRDRDEQQPGEDGQHDPDEAHEPAVWIGSFRTIPDFSVTARRRSTAVSPEAYSDQSGSSSRRYG